MRPPVLLATHDRERLLSDLTLPFDPGALVPGDGAWEVEIGFGKGRYLLRRALAEPRTRLLGIELAGEYFRLLVTRARRRGVRNLLAIRGEAQTLLAAVLPRGFARAVHVYFPDPWPKTRHHRRRLLNAPFLRLLATRMKPGARLSIATEQDRCICRNALMMAATQQSMNRFTKMFALQIP